MEAARDVARIASFPRFVEDREADARRCRNVCETVQAGRAVEDRVGQPLEMPVGPPWGVPDGWTLKNASSVSASRFRSATRLPEVPGSLKRARRISRSSAEIDGKPPLALTRSLRSLQSACNSSTALNATA